MKLATWFARCPPFARSVFVLYAARAALGWLVALPVIRIVGESGVALLPNGDASLFRSGALWLLELLRREERALRAGLETAVLSGLIALAVLSVASALLYATAPRAIARAPAWPRAVSIAPRFLLIGVIEALAIGLVVTVLAISTSGVATSAAAWFDERGRDLVIFVFCIPAILVLSFAAIVADVARTGLVRDQTRVMPALSWAISEVREAAAPLFGGFVLALGTSTLVVALAARGAELCRVEEPGAIRVALVLFIHQGALLALAAIQGWWVRRIDQVLPFPLTHEGQIFRSHENLA